MSNTSNQKRRRAERTRAFIEELIKRFPACFSADAAAVRPLAIGIEKELKKTLAADGDDAPPGWLIRQALARYTRSPAYLAAMMAGGDRIDLEGKAVEPVTESAIAHAKERRAEQKAQAAERRRQRAEQAAEKRQQEKLQRLADHFNQ